MGSEKVPQCRCAFSTPREIVSFLTLQRSSLVNTLSVSNDVQIAKDQFALRRTLNRISGTKSLARPIKSDHSPNCASSRDRCESYSAGHRNHADRLRNRTRMKRRKRIVTDQRFIDANSPRCEATQRGCSCVRKNAEKFTALGGCGSHSLSIEK